MHNDKEAIGRVITQFFQVFDNRNSQTPDFSSMEQLLLPTVVIHKTEQGQLEAMTYSTFLKPRIQLFESGQLSDFHEWETDSQTTINGHLATRISKYEKSGCLDQQSFTGSGTKHFQLIKTQEVWQIAALIWQDN